MKAIQNCFFCRSITTDVQSAAGFCICEIEMEILLSRTASEFSQSLGKDQTFLVWLRFDVMFQCPKQTHILFTERG
jgi:hypothetical protein